jgi:pimeloyl-ACP methyl ester carboxylesterase
MRELTLPIPLVMLPGLGADAELFVKQRRAFGDESVIVPDWPEIREDEPLHLFARRCAEAWGPTLPNRYALCGVSFGGMVAQELLRFLDPRPAVTLLISSARTVEAVPAWANIMGFMAGMPPLPLMAAAHKALSIPFAKLNDGDDEAVAIFRGMAKRGAPRFFQWAIRRIADWEGPPDLLLKPHAPAVHAIHGRRDPVLKCVPELADRCIDDGKHLIFYTHAKTVNRWIFDHVLAVCPEAQGDYPAIEDPDTTVARRAALGAR